MPLKSRVIRDKGSIEDRYMTAAVHVAYRDILQREPSVREIAEGSQKPSSPEGVTSLYHDLLLSKEFISRFVLELPPSLVARVTYTQVFGRSPISDAEIGALTSEIIASGWPACVKRVLTEPEVQARISSEVRRLAQEGSWTARRKDSGWALHFGTAVERPCATLRRSGGEKPRNRGGESVSEDRLASRELRNDPPSTTVSRLFSESISGPPEGTGAKQGINTNRSAKPDQVAR
jgi:hypothetical protein